MATIKGRFSAFLLVPSARSRQFTLARIFNAQTTSLVQWFVPILDT